MHFLAIVYVLFIFSGIFKTDTFKFFPFDPTVGFGAVVGAYMIYRMFTFKAYNVAKASQLLVILPFVIWILITCLFTLSTDYYLEKLVRIPLLYISFLFPVFFLQSEKEFHYIRKGVNIMAIVLLAFLIPLYIAGGNSMVLYFLMRENLVPDYLSLGEILGIAVLMNLSTNSIISIAIKLLSFFFMIQLGGRGPFIFLIIVVVIHVIMHFRLTWKNLAIYSIGLLALPFMVQKFIFSQHTELIVQRLEAVGDEDETSLGERKLFARHAFIMFDEAPLTGKGFGSFGMSYLNYDGRGYPHNILLEILCELGMIGMLLFLPFLWQSLSSGFVVYRDGSVPFYGCICLALLYVFVQTLKSSALTDIRPYFMLAGMTTSIALQLQQKRKMLIHAN